MINRFFLSLFFVWLGSAGLFADEMSLVNPPGALPVEVTVKMHLLNVSAINERNGTFVADLYLDATWKDERLAFSGSSAPKIYTEESAKSKLQSIWWPQLEFVNTNIPEVSNRSLFIYPDGTVNYFLGLTGTFRNHYDFHKFPFDNQKLTILVCSFIWDNKTVKFITNNDYVDIEDTKDQIMQGFYILKLEGEITTERGFLSDINSQFSCFKATISVQRNSLYYFLQICLPILIVLAYGCCIFITDPKEFGHRLNLGLTCMFVFVATKFAIIMQLPEIAYLTVADQIFFLAYLNVSVILLISVIEFFLYKRKSSLFTKFDRAAFRIMPVTFFIAFFLIIALALWT